MTLVPYKCYNTPNKTTNIHGKAATPIAMVKYICYHWGKLKALPHFVNHAPCNNLCVVMQCFSVYTQAHVQRKTASPVQETVQRVENTRQQPSPDITKQQMVEVVEDVSEEERVPGTPQWNYSDEEYEEDFEEDLEDSDDNKEAEEQSSSSIEQDVLQAIAAENLDVYHAKATLPSAPSPPSHFSPAHKVDFSFAKSTSASPVPISATATKKVLSRARELLELVELDTLSFTLFELQPLSEYDVYMRNYGCSDTRQVSVVEVWL